MNDLQLYRVFDVPHISQVYFFYLCALENGDYGVGPESSEVVLVGERDVPWDDIAFPVVRDTLQSYFADRRRGEFPVVVETIDVRRPRGD